MSLLIGVPRESCNLSFSFEALFLVRRNEQKYFRAEAYR